MEIEIGNRNSDERLKKLAEGPLGQYVNRIPLQFCQAVLIASRHPADGSPVQMKNGTMTLLRLSGRQLGVTCNHVVQSYFDSVNNGYETLFQVGNHRVNPPTQLISSNAELDLAVFDLSEWTELRNTHPEIGCCFFEPRAWPPKMPTSNNSVEIGGFPGLFRDRNGNEIEFGTWSAAKMPVRSVRADVVTIQFEREHWIELPAARSGLAFRKLGGISGGPVTIEWTNPSGLWIVDLVAIAFEYSEDYDLLLARPIGLINEDGTISSGPDGMP